MKSSGTNQILRDLQKKEDSKKAADEKKASSGPAAVIKEKAEAKGGDVRQGAFGPSASAVMEGGASAEGSITQLAIDPTLASKDALNAFERVMNRAAAPVAEMTSTHEPSNQTYRPF